MSLVAVKQMPGHLVRRIQQIHWSLFSEEMGGFELTSVQFIALVAIKDTPNLDATRLAGLIVFDRATIGGVIERLERKGLVERKANAKDKRAKVLRITPAGRALITVSYACVERVQNRLLASLSAEERPQLLGLLTKIVEDHNGAVTASTDRHRVP